MPGIKEGRGQWDYRLLTLTSASTISQGSAVVLAGARTVSEYSGGQGGILGFIKHDSQQSLPAGKAVIAIPRAGCTAFIDVPTGVVASALSLGESYGLYKLTNFCSYLTTGYTSAASRVVSLVGTLDSTTSTIEVAFLQDALQFNSTTSVVI